MLARYGVGLPAEEVTASANVSDAESAWRDGSEGVSQASCAWQTMAVVAGKPKARRRGSRVW